MSKWTTSNADYQHIYMQIVTAAEKKGMEQVILWRQSFSLLLFLSNYIIVRCKYRNKNSVICCKRKKTKRMSWYSLELFRVLNKYFQWSALAMKLYCFYICQSLEDHSIISSGKNVECTNFYAFSVTILRSKNRVCSFETWERILKGNLTYFLSCIKTYKRSTGHSKSITYP